MKTKAVVFGVGDNMFRAYTWLRDHYEIMAFLDNDVAKHGIQIGNAAISAVVDCRRYAFDLAIVTPTKHEAVCVQLLEAGVPAEKIVLLRELVGSYHGKETLTVAFVLSGTLADYLAAANYIWLLHHKVLSCGTRLDVFCESGETWGRFVFQGSAMIHRVYEFPIGDTRFSDYDLILRVAPYPVVLWRNDYYLSHLSPACVDYVTVLEKFRIMFSDFVDHPNMLSAHIAIYGEICRKSRLELADVDGSLGMTQEYLYELPAAGEHTSSSYEIVVNRIPSHSVKDWPRDYWEELCGVLRENGHRLLVLQDRFEDTYMAEADGAIFRLSLRQLSPILKECRLFIGIDDPLLSLRHALRGGASIGLYGATSPDFWGFSKNHNIRAKVCPHWCEGTFENWEKRCSMGCDEAICMRAITPEQVMYETEDILREVTCRVR